MSVANESPEPESVVAKEEEPPKKAIKKFARRYGSRSEVFDSGVAEMTRGGLRKEDLMLSRTGKIVSKKKSASAKALYAEFGFNKRTKPKPAPIKEQPKKKRKRKTKKSKKTE